MMHFAIDLQPIVLMTFYACKSTNHLKVKSAFCSFQGEKLQYKIYAFFWKELLINREIFPCINIGQLNQVETNLFEKKIIPKKNYYNHLLKPKVNCQLYTWSRRIESNC
jgi:hypothetical protein